MHILSGGGGGGGGGGDPQRTLLACLDAPPVKAITSALERLKVIGAVDESFDGGVFYLTSLGKTLSRLPMDVQVGKMVLFGVLFGCLDPIVTIAAAISYQTPFVSPVDKRKQAELSKMKLATGASDLITLLNAVNMWQKSRRESRHAERVFLEDHFLKRASLVTILDVKRDYLNLLRSSGMLRGNADPDRNATNMALVRAVICAGLYPNFSLCPPPASSTANPPPNETQAGTVSIHPSSVLHTSKFKRTPGEALWMVYHELSRSNKVYIRDNTIVPGISILLFGSDFTVVAEKGLVKVANWAQMRIHPRSAILIRNFRSLIDKVLTSTYNTRDRTAGPEEEALGAKVLNLVRELVTHK